MNIEQSKIYVDVLKTLAHPIRVLLVDAISKKDMCVNELTAMTEIDQSGISRHLNKLLKVGILSAKKIGKQVIYHLETPCILKTFKCALDIVKAEAEKKNELLKLTL